MKTFSPLFIAAMVATLEQNRIRLYYCFQSAFHRGNGCYKGILSIAKISPDNTFSPLFIAAMVATTYKIKSSDDLERLSVLFIAAMVATSGRDG